MAPQRRTSSVKTTSLHNIKKNGTRTTHHLATEPPPITTTLHDVEILKPTRKQMSPTRSLQRIWNNPNSPQYLHIYRCPDLSVADMLKNPPTRQMKRWTRTECEKQKMNCLLIGKKNSVWYDGKGEKLYLPGFVDEKLALEVELELQ
jgi:hypothetical protein